MPAYRQKSDEALAQAIASLERDLDVLDDCDYHPRAAAERERAVAALVRARAEQERRRMLACRTGTR